MFLGWLFGKRKKIKPKLGLALGSGGAKGLTHIGALKAFEENGIEFDIVAGASIGSVIGAMYAQNYSSHDILNLVNAVNFDDIKRSFMIRMDTGSVKELFDKNLGDVTFDELKKPFKAVATDSVTGEEVVLDKGNVAISLCASCCYPPFFKPVEIDGRLLIDGAFTNSIPADLVKGMGADIVVGIDLSAFKSEEKKSFFIKLIPQVKVGKDNPQEAGYINSDIMLRPNLGEYTALSFSGMNEMYEIGYNEALKMIPQIKRLIDDFGKKKK